MQGVRWFIVTVFLLFCAAGLARESVQADENIAAAARAQHVPRAFIPPDGPSIGEAAPIATVLRPNSLLKTARVGETDATAGVPSSVFGGNRGTAGHPSSGTQLFQRAPDEGLVTITDAAKRGSSANGTSATVRFVTGIQSADDESIEDIEPGVFVSDQVDLWSDPQFAVPKFPPYGNLWHDFENRGRLWARGEYLSWRVEGDQLPPLVTTSPLGTAQAAAGAIGFASTSVLFGDDRANDEERSGGRLTLGYGLLDGFQVDYWILENPSERFDASSFGDPTLARPTFNVSTNVSSQDFIALANFNPGKFNVAGAINIETSSEIQSGGATFSHMLWMDSSNPARRYWRVNLIGGYRFFDVEESVAIRQTNFFTGGPFAPGSRRDRFEEFKTQNLFHGGEVGVAGFFQWGRVSFDALGKVALGNMYSKMRVDGATFDFDPISGLSTSLGGGLLAGPARIGTRSQDNFAAIPEFNLTVGLQLTPNLKATAGYSVIYVPHVVRPGENIHLSVNPGNAANVPVVALRDIDLWILGINGGLEVRF